MTREELWSLGWSDEQLADSYAQTFGKRPGLSSLEADTDALQRRRRKLLDELQLELSGNVRTDVLGPKIGAFAELSKRP